MTTRRPKNDFPGLILSFVLLWVLLPGGSAVRCEEKNFPDVIKVAYSTRLMGDVDSRDAQVGIDAFARELSRLAGVKTVPRAVLFTEPGPILDSLKRKEIDLISLPAIDYLRIREREVLEPAFVASNQVDRGQERILVVHQGNPQRSAASLRQKALLAAARSRDEITHLWLENVVAREGSPDLQTHFGRVKEVTKASQAFLSLFFRQADAAAGPRGVFETMAQLNPQIGEQLTVIAQSRSLVGYISCFRRDFNQTLKDIIRERAVRMNDAPNLKQMFILLQVDRIVLFQPSYLENLAEMWKEHQNARAKFANRK
jgi:ABC-type phosphate/phosphonate transport system substrate-binding protein